MLFFPNCKINIGLSITEKRSDGFHNLESIFLPIGLKDILEVIPADKGVVEFATSGIEIDSEIEKISCVKAFRLLQLDFDIQGIKAQLHKIIPLGAGLGGGSSDGSFMLMALNDLFQLGLNKEQLASYASKLGSDCPFFIQNKPAFVTGTGDQMEPISIDLKGKFIVVVYPNIHVNTAKAFGLIQPKKANFDLRQLCSIPMSDWKMTVINDFEQAIGGHYPQILTIKDQLYAAGALYASMSGSGSAVYGLFDQETVGIQDQFVNYFTWQGPL